MRALSDNGLKDVVTAPRELVLVNFGQTA